MITGHMLVKNEERWVWYALNSILDLCDEILVWDTGSTDKTVDIIKTIKSPKIKFKQTKLVTPEDHTRLRQEMLKKTKPGWIFIADGDEIWPTIAISETKRYIQEKGESTEYLVYPYYSLLGDIYHYQERRGGNYKIRDLTGHYNIRAINADKIPGLHFSRPHGQQGLCDSKNVLVQDRVPSRGHLINIRYFHASHLLRSSSKKSDSKVIKRTLKYKYELGIPFPEGFAYPAVFYLPRPKIVPSPWRKRDATYNFKALIQSPLKFIRRRILQLPSGY